MENMILESKIVVRFVENPKVYERDRIVVQFSGTKETLYGGVAQLGEHLPCKQGVMGSNPIISTNHTLEYDAHEMEAIHNLQCWRIAQLVRARA